ncbi:MAG: VWA domain-containing protein [Bacilli bacterium]|nr:VWA domain-containing protein [Bacilli bacterium]
MRQKQGTSLFVKIIAVLIGFMFVIPFIAGLFESVSEVFSNRFVLISSESNKVFDSELKEYAKKSGIDLKVEYYGDLEIVDLLNSSADNYDGVWISNSLWFYMLDNPYLVTDSKSISINPVVMGISKSKAQELGFVNSDVYNRDILNAIADKKLSYVMTSVTKTNTGATAYLGFLNSIAGSPEVLTSEMLSNDNLRNSMKAFFNGVERVSGDEDYLTDMFLNGKYEAVINYESTLINLNQKLVSEGKEPLYLIYPVDGVAINDMPFGYVSHGQNDKKKEQFKTLQDYLRSKNVRDKLEEKGFRSWYGGINNNPNTLFNKDWGIDTSKYLISLKYPSKAVINEAFDLYAEELRKPAHVVFCLDVSGSMYGEGISELKEAMKYILNKEEARKDRIQFTKADKITIVTFDSTVKSVSETVAGDNTEILEYFVDELEADGGTNIYDPSIRALDILKNTDENYSKVIVLMTDGQSNSGSLYSLENRYSYDNQNIPIYGITFGNAYKPDLEDVASLSNGKVFDGKSGLKKAFEEVRSYS